MCLVSKRENERTEAFEKATSPIVAQTGPTSIDRNRDLRTLRPPVPVILHCLVQPLFPPLFPELSGM